MEEKSESESIDLILSLLANENTYIKLSQLLSGFEKEAGHSLPLFGHKTIEQFLKSISNKIQVLLVEEDIYVKLNTEGSANSENDLTHAQNEVDRVDEDVNKVDDDVNKVEDDNKGDDNVSKGDDNLNKGDDNVSKGDDNVSKGDDNVSKGDDNLNKVDDDADKVDVDANRVDVDANKVHDDADKVDDDADKVDVDADKVDVDANKVHDDANKVDDDADKVDVDADKVDDDADKVDVNADKVDDDADKVDVDADKVDDDADKVDDDADKVDVDANKVDVDANKVDDDADKVDVDAKKVNDDVNKVDDDANKVDEDLNKVDDNVNKVDDDVNEVDDDENKQDDDENKDDPSPSNSAAAAPSSNDIPEEAKSDEESKIEMINEERDDNACENLNFMSSCGIDEEYEYEESAEKEPQEEEGLCEECVPVVERECEPCIDNCLSSIILDESDIPMINLLDHMKVSDCIRVAVPEVRNPHRFILQLQKYQSELTTVMRRMQTLYNLCGEKYELGDYKFTTNQVCAVLYRTNPKGREWYRAKILNFDTYNSLVLLVDYGIVTNVANNNIKYLDRDFGYLPMQALNGHLANIKPYKGKYWSEDCCKRFYESVFEEDLVAQVIRMDPKRRWLSVILSYVDAQGYLINENLVRGKFPIADCDFNEEEQFSPVIYDSISAKEFIQAEEVGKTRRLKSEYGKRDEFNSKRKGRCRHRNRAHRKLFGPDLSGEGLSTETE